MASPVSPTTPRNVTAVQRRVEAIRLRRAGASLEQIAQQLGYHDRSGARKAILAGLSELHKEITASAEQLRALELSRIDELYLATHRLAKAGDLQALDRCIKLIELRAKFLGLFTQTEAPLGELTINVVYDQK